MGLRDPMGQSDPQLYGAPYGAEGPTALWGRGTHSSMGRHMGLRDPQLYGAEAPTALWGAIWG